MVTETPPFDGQNPLPVVVQDALTKEVLGLEQMNASAWKKTLKTKTLYVLSSGKKIAEKRFGKKEKSHLSKILVNTKGQILALVESPASKITPWERSNQNAFSLQSLHQLLERGDLKSKKGLDVSQMLGKGSEYLAKKLAEEAMEVALTSVRSRFKNDDFLEENADLLYYVLLLSHSHGMCFSEIIQRLWERQS